MAKKVVLLGGGHAHLQTLAAIGSFQARGCEVTVVQPSPWHYYSGMGPGMLGGSYRPEEIRFATRRQVEALGGRFVLARAERIDPEAKRVHLAGSEEVLPYDLLSCNVGSSVRWSTTGGESENLYAAKPIEGLLAVRDRVLALAAAGPCRLAVVGGGPAALEIAGNLHQLTGRAGLHRPKIVLYAGRQILVGRSPRLVRLARDILLDKGIRIVEGLYVVRVDGERLLFADGSQTQAALTILATGVEPNRLFAHSGLALGNDGGLLVNGCLQSVAYPDIFAGGDCIAFAPRPLAKVGVYAVRQNRVLCENLMAFLQDRPLVEFSPGGAYLQICNLGMGIGLFSREGISFSGRLAFWLKDWIDRRFMRTYQMEMGNQMALPEGDEGGGDGQAKR